MKFSHGGAMGDIIYHLPIIKELGGGSLYIIPAGRDGYRTPRDMQFTALFPLLEEQSYIRKVEWSETPVGICFDAWRNRLDFSKNLTDQAAQWLGMAPLDPLKKWLTVKHKKEVAPVVFARSLNVNFHPAFDWRKLVDHYRGNSVFLGLSHEHESFQAACGEIPYHPTKSLLEAAQIIAGAKLFIGNPTCLTAVAEGLKQRMIIASADFVGSCVYFARPKEELQHCWDTVEPMEI